jgi:hypothetical protein
LNVDKLKKFFKKEDREHKAKYNSWLEQSKEVFDYDSDLEETVVEEIGAETSKMDLPAEEDLDKATEDQSLNELKAPDVKEADEDEIEDSDDESF